MPWQLDTALLLPQQRRLVAVLEDCVALREVWVSEGERKEGEEMREGRKEGR